MNIQHTISLIQDRLGITSDGIAGPETWEAIRKKIIGDDAPSLTIFDERTEKNIATLLPQVQPYARSLVHSAAHQGIIIKVTSALRTYAEQNALYAKGRTTPGPKVTNARAGQSWHNFGVAFDVTIFNGKTPVYESPVYKAIGAMGQSLGLAWGGSWKSFKDEPHMEMTNGKSLAEARDLYDQGKTVFA